MPEPREPTVGGSFSRRVILSPDRSLAHLVRGSLARPRGGGGGRRGRRRNYGNAEIAVVAEERRPIPQLRSHLACFLFFSLPLSQNPHSENCIRTDALQLFCTERGRDTSFVTPRHLSEALPGFCFALRTAAACACRAWRSSTPALTEFYLQSERFVLIKLCR